MSDDASLRPNLIPERIPDAESISISLDSLPPSDELGGKEPSKSFVDSVKQFGLLNPITLVGMPGNFILAAGRRRVKAARQAGFETVPARIYCSDDMSPHVILLIENAARSANAAAEFLAAVNLLNEGYDITEIMDAVGMGKATADKLLKLVSLTPTMLAILGDDRMSEETAFQATKLSREEQDDLTRGKETGGRITGEDVKEITQAKQRAAKAAAEAAEAERRKVEDERRARELEEAVAKAKADAERKAEEAEAARVEAEARAKEARAVAEAEAAVKAEEARKQAEIDQAEAVAEAKRRAQAEKERAVAQAREEEIAKAREEADARAREVEAAEAEAERKQAETEAEVAGRAEAKKVEVERKQEEIGEEVVEATPKVQVSWSKKALIMFRMVVQTVPLYISIPPDVNLSISKVYEWLKSQ